MNKWIDKNEFMNLLKDGQSIFVGGFLTCGTPELLIDWVVESQVKDLTIICNDAGRPEQGVGKLIANSQVKKLIATHIGTNPKAGEGMALKTLDVTLVPQGTLVEQIRAHAAGLGGILTPVGLNTLVEIGKEKIDVQGKTYILEIALGADLALVEAKEADILGNLTYDKTARNFNPVMAMAAQTTIVYVYKKVDEIHPEHVITPHIFVNYLIEGGNKHA